MPQTGTIRVALPDVFLEGIDSLIAAGLYTSRSEVVTEALRRLLHSEVKHLSRLRALGWL